MTIFLAAALRPFVLFVTLCALASVRIAIESWWPEGRIKRLLLSEI